MRVTNELSKYDLARHESPSSSVVSYIATGVWEVMSLIPVGDSDFFFVPSSLHLNIPSFLMGVVSSPGGGYCLFPFPLFFVLFPFSIGSIFFFC